MSAKKTDCIVREHFESPVVRWDMHRLLILLLLSGCSHQAAKPDASAKGLPALPGALLEGGHQPAMPVPPGPPVRVFARARPLLRGCYEPQLRVNPAQSPDKLHQSWHFSPGSL